MGSFDSLIFYIVSFSISVLSYGLYVKFNRRVFLWFSFAIPVLIGGLRYMVGTDYPTYEASCKMVSNDVPALEIGYWLIKRISKAVGSTQVLFFVFNFLTVLFFYLGLNNIQKRSRTFALFCFFFLFYTSSFNIMRQMLAVTIFFFSIKYIKEKRPVRYIMFMIFASSFHTTALLALLMYPAIASRNKHLKALCIVLLLIGTFTLEGIISWLSGFEILGRYEMYSVYSGNSIFNNYSFYEYLLLLIYFMANKRKLLKLDINNRLLMYIYTIGVVLAFSGFMSPFVKRVSLYFCLPAVLLMGEVPLATNRPANRVLSYLSLGAFVVLDFTINAYFLRHADVIPYNWIGGVA